MDSLLSVDELPAETNLPPPKLPPKTKFVSTGNLGPPALPPKQRNFGKVLKRVAISTDEVRIIGIGGYSDDNTDFYDEDDDSYRSVD